LVQPGDWVVAKVKSANTNTLFGEMVEKVNGISDFKAKGYTTDGQSSAKLVN
jgi:hypothetical protein